MNINKRLLEKILRKHNLEYDASKKVSEIEYDYENKYYFIFYGSLRLPFDKDWLEGNHDYLIPSSKMVSSNVVFLGIVANFKLFKTKTGEYYYELIKKFDLPDISFKNLTPDEYKIFQSLVPNSKKILDELIFEDRMFWKNKHSIDDIFIKDDGTTDLFLMSQLGDPKLGCSFHQNRVHSRTGKTPGYPTIEQAKIDGYQWPNCRHTMSPFYPGYSKIPQSINYTIYEQSKRSKKIRNSEKIRNRQRTLSKIDPQKNKSLYLKKNKEIEKLKKDGYLKDKIY